MAWYQCFRGTCSLNLQYHSSALNMEEAGLSETFVHIYQTSASHTRRLWRYNKNIKICIAIALIENVWSRLYETKERKMVYQTIVTKTFVRSLGTPRRVLVLYFVIQPVCTDKYQMRCWECLTPAQITAMSKACGFKYRQEHFSRVA